MPDPFLLSIGVILSLAAFFILVYYLLQTRKGSLKIHLQQTAFQPNSLIQGKLHLKTKEEIASKGLFISLVGLWRVNAKGGGEKEIYRKEIALEGEKTYEAGFEKTYGFAIPTPQPPSNIRSLPILPGLPFSLTIHPRTFRWEIHARLSTQGGALGDRKEIYINNYSPPLSKKTQSQTHKKNRVLLEDIS